MSGWWIWQTVRATTRCVRRGGVRIRQVGSGLLLTWMLGAGCDVVGRDVDVVFDPPPRVERATCGGAGEARDALVFGYDDMGGGEAVDVTVTYAVEAVDVFDAPEAAFPVRDGSGVVTLFLEEVEGGCAAFVRGAGHYGLDLRLGEDAVVRAVVRYIPG